MKQRMMDFVETLDFQDTFILDDKQNTAYSYGVVFRQSIDLAKRLSELLPQGDIVAVLDNSYILLLLYFAVIFTDKKILVADPLKGEKEIEEILTGVPQGLLIAEDGLTLSCGDGLRQCSVAELERITEAEGAAATKQEVLDGLACRDFEDAYLVTYTSGTSGVTKGVVHSLNNLLGTSYALAGKVKSKEKGCLMHVMPMTYMAGILNSVFYPFVTGNRIAILGRFNVKTAHSFWKKAQEYEASLFWVAPAMLMMIEAMDRSGLGESYCTEYQPVFLVGTAPLTDNVRDKFEARYGVRLRASYGLSETLFISVETPESIERKICSNVGELLEGVLYRYSAEGELFLSVPWMYLGYTNENTAEYFDGDYYKTGDLAEYREECLYIVGRKKELIIKGGMNISPVRIEECANRCPHILESAAFGRADESGEELVCLAYAVEDGTQVTSKELEQQLNRIIMEELGKNYKVDCFMPVARLPRNINGKVDRNCLKMGGD